MIFLALCLEVRRESGLIRKSRLAEERRDARAVEWGGLENRYTRKGIGGSNPPPAVTRPKFSAGLRKTSWGAIPSEVQILSPPLSYGIEKNRCTRKGIARFESFSSPFL